MLRGEQAHAAKCLYLALSLVTKTKGKREKTKPGSSYGVSSCGWERDLGQEEDREQKGQLSAKDCTS